MITIWKSGMEAPLLNISGMSSEVSTMCLNSIDAELHSGLKGGLLIIWDLESSKSKINLNGHSTPVTAISPYNNGGASAVISASLDGKIKVWDLRSKQASLNLKAHSEPIKALAISPNGRYLASGGEGGVLKLWDLKMGKLLKELSIESQAEINCIEFNPYAVTLAYGSSDRTIKHWDLETFSLISVTSIDRTPILKLKFDECGKNVFSCTNESLKYWNVSKEDPKLISIMETGWKQLQDFQLIENQAVYGLGIIGNKISLWTGQIESLTENLSNRKQTNVKPISNDNSELKYLKNNNLVGDFFQRKEEVDINISQFINNRDFSNNGSTDLYQSNFFHNKNDVNETNNFYNNNTKNTSILNESSNSRIFRDNAMNIIKPNYGSDNFKAEVKPKFQDYHDIIIQKNFVINNINSNVNISDILKENLSNNENVSINNDSIQIDNSHLDNFFNPNQKNSENFTLNYANHTNTSFKSLRTNEPMNLDLNKFLYVNPDETIHSISQSNDLSLINQIDEKHPTIKNVILKRYNSLKMILKCWSESNVSSTINALKLLKDISISNDFFKFGLIEREDFEKIPLTMEHTVELLNLIILLIKSKYESYNITGCKSGLIILQIFSSINSQNKNSIENIHDTREERNKKFDQVINVLHNIHKEPNLSKICNKSNSELNKYANSFFTDLEFFLKPYNK